MNNLEKFRKMNRRHFGYFLLLWLIGGGCAGEVARDNRTADVESPVADTAQSLESDTATLGVIPDPPFVDKTYKARVIDMVLRFTDEYVEVITEKEGQRVPLVRDTTLAHWSIKQDSVWIEPDLMYADEPLLKGGKLRFDGRLFQAPRYGDPRCTVRFEEVPANDSQ